MGGVANTCWADESKHMLLDIITPESELVTALSA